MKERNCLEWIVLCELLRRRKRHAIKTFDAYVMSDAATLCSEYKELNATRGSFSGWWRFVGEEITKAVAGVPTNGDSDSMNQLHRWYRNGGQF